MNGEQLIQYILVPSIIAITAGFIVATLVIIRNNTSKSAKIIEKQDKIYDVNVNIEAKVSKMHDMITNQLTPSLNYIKQGVEELNFKPTIEKIKSILNDMELEFDVISEDETLGFGIAYGDEEFKISYILHFVKEFEMIHVEAISNTISVEKIESNILWILMKINSEIVVGNLYLNESKNIYPLVSNYTFKANKSNFDISVFEDVIYGLAAPHKKVMDQFKAIGVKTNFIELNDYIALQQNPEQAS